jgi:hypothetical protein
MIARETVRKRRTGLEVNVRNSNFGLFAAWLTLLLSYEEIATGDGGGDV